MIYSGSNAIADVKLGSLQVAAVYRGADLIWEKNSAVDFSIPYYKNGAAVVRLTGSDTLQKTVGFSLAMSGTVLNYNTAKYSAFCALDGDSTTKYTPDTTGAARIDIKFPVELETAVITRIDISESETVGKIYIGARANIDTSNGAFAGSTLYADYSGNGTYYPSASAEGKACSAIRITKASSGSSGKSLGNFTIYFTADKDRFAAWKSSYFPNVEI